MGILDSVFSGENGLVNKLHSMFGGKCVFKKAFFKRNLETGSLETYYVSFDCAFVPSNNNLNEVSASAPKDNPPGITEGETTISGSIPADGIPIPIVGRDLIVYQGKEYMITDFSATQVGEVNLEYSIRARIT